MFDPVQAAKITALQNPHNYYNDQKLANKEILGSASIFFMSFKPDFFFFDPGR